MFKLSLIFEFDKEMIEKPKVTISRFQGFNFDEKMSIFEMSLSLQNFKFFSQNFIKSRIQGVFRNPQDKQIPKLSLGFQFDHDLIEKTRKHLVAFLMISTVILKMDIQPTK